MAGRIRSIKPEILSDEATGVLPHLEWRLFVSLWLLADDYGNLAGAPAQLQGAILWGTGETPAQVAAALAELERAGLVIRYSVNGKAHVHINGWSKHQKIDRPSKPIYTGPDQADTDTRECSSSARETDTETRRILDADQDHGPGPRSGPGPSTDPPSAGAGAVRPVKGKGARKRPAITMPEDFGPNEGHRGYAADNRLDLDGEVTRFRLHHAAKGSVFASWDAALSTWLHNAVRFRAGPAGTGSHRPIRGQAPASPTAPRHDGEQEP